MSPIKEPGYFSRDRFLEDVRRSIPQLRSEEGYMTCFTKAGPHHKIVGESSTSYLRSETDLLGIRAFSGDPKIIAMVRDPADLVASYFHYQRFTGWEPATTLHEAWGLQDDRCSGDVRSVTASLPDSLAYRDVAMLGRQVGRLLRLFPHDRVLVLVMNDLKKRPKEVGREVQAFAEVSHVDLEMPSDNRARKARLQWLDDLVKRPPWIVRWGKNRVKRLVGVRELGLRRVVDKLNATQAFPTVEHNLKAEMREYFRDDVELLSSILRRDLLELWGWR
jgi:hypothetical protein